MNITLGKKQRDIAYSLIIVIAMFVFVTGLTFIQKESKTADVYLQEAWASIDAGYALSHSQSLFEQVIELDATNEQALYSLARIYYIKGEYTQAVAMIDSYKELYPEKKRIYYISGLTHSYADRLEFARGEFTTFIASGEAGWPAYLDLAWVEFKLGKFTEAQTVLDEAVNLFGTNTWLNTSLGAVSIALGDSVTAAEYLEEALIQAGELTKEDWHQNYSFNNPESFDNELAQMRDVITFNLALAHGEESDVSPAKMINIAFADMSPYGLSHGLVVSACGDSCNVTSCVSQVNVCGDFNTGTMNSCTGNVCSAANPVDPDPELNCSVSTACGPAPGSLGCNGQCNLSRYPICPLIIAEDPEGENATSTTDITLTGGGIIWFPAVDEGTVAGAGSEQITGNIAATPLLVLSGQRTVIVWHSTETESCDIYGSNGDEWLDQEIYGNDLSSPITGEVTYTLECTGYDDTIVTDSIVVKIIPSVQEI